MKIAAQMENGGDESAIPFDGPLGHDDSDTSSDLGDSINLDDGIGVNVQDRIQPYLEIGKQLHVSGREGFCWYPTF